MLKVIVGEDNPHERLILKKMLSRIPEVVVVGEADNGNDLVRLVDKLAPHIVFLDIDMPGANGLEAAREIAELNAKTFVVFATAYDNYAREAFEVQGFHYMTKPFEMNRINKIIERVKEIISNPSMISFESNEKLINCKEKLIVQVNESLYFIKVNEILMVTRSDRKTDIHTISGIYKVSDTLEKIEAKLGYIFFRCHKGYIINPNMITKLEPWGNKTYVVHLENTKETALMTLDKLKLLKQLHCV